jgi:hypothetical protein
VRIRDQDLARKRPSPVRLRRLHPVRLGNIFDSQAIISPQQIPRFGLHVTRNSLHHLSPREYECTARERGSLVRRDVKPYAPRSMSDDDSRTRARQQPGRITNIPCENCDGAFVAGRTQTIEKLSSNHPLRMNERTEEGQRRGTGCVPARQCEVSE